MKESACSTRSGVASTGAALSPGSRRSMPGYRTKQERIAIAGVADLVIRSLLELTPGERARLAVQEAGHLDRALAVAQKRRR